MNIPEIRATLLGLGVALQEMDIAMRVSKRRMAALAQREIAKALSKIHGAFLHLHLTYTWVEKKPNAIDHKFFVDIVEESGGPTTRCVYVEVEFILDHSSPVQSKWHIRPGNIITRLSPEGETEDMDGTEMQTTAVDPHELPDPKGDADKQLISQADTNDLLRKIFGKDFSS